MTACRLISAFRTHQATIRASQLLTNTFAVRKKLLRRGRGSSVLPSDELVYVEELRQEEVPDDHEHDQTHGNNNTSESLTRPDHRSNDRPRDQADRKPDRRILHVAEHELTLARPTSVRSAAARDRHADFTKKGDEGRPHALGWARARGRAIAQPSARTIPRMGNSP